MDILFNIIKLKIDKKSILYDIVDERRPGSTAVGNWKVVYPVINLFKSIFNFL